MKKDIHNKIKVAVARNIGAISSDTTTSGVIIDTLGYESLEFVIFSGTITDGSFAPLIQVSNDSGLANPVTITTDSNKILGSVANATFVAADDNAVKKIGVRADGYRYVRLSIVSTGVTTGGTLGAIAILDHSMVKPVA